MPRPKKINFVANFLVNLDELRQLVGRLEVMRTELSQMVSDLRMSQQVLEHTWQGGAAPGHVRAEMERIAGSISENTDALDRLSMALQKIQAAYETADAEIDRAFRV